MANNIISALSEAAITDSGWGFEVKYNRAEHHGDATEGRFRLLHAYKYVNRERKRERPGGAHALTPGPSCYARRTPVPGGRERKRGRGCSEESRPRPCVDPSFSVCRLVHAFASARLEEYPCPLSPR